jgi:hypothetical protein
VYGHLTGARANGLCRRRKERHDSLLDMFSALATRFGKESKKEKG